MSFSGLSISIQANTADGSQILSGKYSYLQFGGGISASIDVSNSLFSYISISNGNIMCTNCIIGDMANASSSEGSTFLNCIFTSEGNIGGSYPGGISTSFINTNSSYLFDHCIFLDNLLSTGASNPLPQVIFSNCIFSGFNASNCFPVNTAFNSNLFIDFSIDNTGFCNPLVASNNIMNAPDPYVNGTLSNILTADFNLTVTSAGNNAASDGTDIGLHGGVHAWPLSYHYGAYPPGVPVVNSLTLENYIIGTSDQLQMNAQGSIPSNE
jgi:hypothetical protein